MEIQGLDYNTQREQLILAEYGREIQKMVDHCLTLTDRQERQACAEKIVQTMATMSKQKRDSAGKMQKLWDHLAIMSNFKLDIDYPFDIQKAKQLEQQPDPIAYPMADIPVRHYGKLLFEAFEKLKQMPEGTERNELVYSIANQMKRNLSAFGHGNNDAQRVASDLEFFTDGKIKINPEEFVFEKTPTPTVVKTKRKRK